jgi:hypothetical protein
MSISPFANSDLFEVEVKYVEATLKSGIKTIMVIKDKTQEEKHKDKINVIRTQWSQPNWKESWKLSEDSHVFEESLGEKRFDYQLYRKNILERFLKIWDIVDDKKMPIPVNEENINKLDPNIASNMIDGWLKKTNPAEADLGN